LTLFAQSAKKGAGEKKKKKKKGNPRRHRARPPTEPPETILPREIRGEKNEKKGECRRSARLSLNFLAPWAASGKKKDKGGKGGGKKPLSVSDVTKREEKEEKREATIQP